MSGGDKLNSFLGWVIRLAFFPLSSEPEHVKGETKTVALSIMLHAIIFFKPSLRNLLLGCVWPVVHGQLTEHFSFD